MVFYITAVISHRITCINEFEDKFVTKNYKNIKDFLLNSKSNFLTTNGKDEQKTTFCECHEQSVQ